MPTMSQLRSGLATRLATISGLRTTSTIPDSISPPIAVIFPGSITYDTAFARSGGDEYEFFVTVIVGRMDERSAQNKLDGYCDPTGSGSVKTAIEADKTLGGQAFTCRVTAMRNYNSIIVGDTTYLAAEFVVQVYA